MAYDNQDNVELSTFSPPGGSTYDSICRLAARSKHDVTIILGHPSSAALLRTNSLSKWAS